MIVISRDLRLARLADPNWTAENNPLVGWRNLITPPMLVATYSDVNFPASNLANEATDQKWKSTATTEQYVTVNTGEEEPGLSDYVAIAKHNLGTAAVEISVEGFVAGEWVELIAPALLPDNNATIFQFGPTALAQIRLKLVGGSEIPEIAVMYFGLLLVLQRRIYVGHTPITMGRTTRVANGMSENGNFLGRIVLSEGYETAVPMSNITPAWYRANIDPFLKSAKERPFFFAWRPADYPREVGYAWLTNDPKPTNQRPNGMMQVSLQLSGITG